MRICAIGNSHCGSLVTSWREHFEKKSGHTLTFFAARGGRVESLRVSLGSLVSENEEVAKMLAFTSGGTSKVAPELYDRFLVYGLLKQPPATDNDDGFSLSLREAVLADRFEKSLAKTIVNRLRQLTDKPIDVAPAPFQFAQNGASPANWTLSLEDEEGSFRRLFDGIGASYLPQPPETVVPGGTRATRPEFSDGSQRLAISQSTVNEKHADRDVKHTNDQYGAIWLQAYIEGLP